MRLHFAGRLALQTLSLAGYKDHGLGPMWQGAEGSLWGLREADHQQPERSWGLQSHGCKEMSSTINLHELGKWILLPS